MSILCFLEDIHRWLKRKKSSLDSSICFFVAARVLFWRFIQCWQEDHRNNNSAIRWHFLGHLYGKYVWIIGLKDSGNYSDQFRSNKFAALLWERTKLHIPRVLDLWDLWESLFIDFIGLFMDSIYVDIQMNYASISYRYRRVEISVVLCWWFRWPCNNR